MLRKILVGFAAGKNLSFFDQIPDDEKAKFYGLGVLILTISAIALASMVFSLSLIYPPPPDDNEIAVGTRYILISIISILWALVIFNYYRFSLSLDTVNKSKVSFSDAPSFLIRFGFGVMLGAMAGVLITVLLLQKEISASGLTPIQKSVLSSINERVKLKYEDDLASNYASLQEHLAAKRNLSSRFASIEKLQDADQNSVMELKDKLIEQSQKVEIIQKKIDTLRTSYANELFTSEEAYKNQRSLLTSIDKTIRIHPYLTLIICVFITFALTFPAIFQLLSLPGVYEYLSEYEGHAVLAAHGVLVNSSEVFHGRSRLTVPYYAKADAILQDEKSTLHKKLLESHSTKYS